MEGLEVLVNRINVKIKPFDLIKFNFYVAIFGYRSNLKNNINIISFHCLIPKNKTCLKYMKLLSSFIFSS